MVAYFIQVGDGRIGGRYHIFQILGFHAGGGIQDDHGIGGDGGIADDLLIGGDGREGDQEVFLCILHGNGQTQGGAVFHYGLIGPDGAGGVGIDLVVIVDEGGILIEGGSIDDTPVRSGGKADGEIGAQQGHNEQAGQKG